MTCRFTKACVWPAPDGICAHHAAMEQLSLIAPGSASGPLFDRIATTTKGQRKVKGPPCPKCASSWTPKIDKRYGGQLRRCGVCLHVFSARS